MQLGPIRMYLIMGAENIQAIFRHSKQLSFEFMQLRIAQPVWFPSELPIQGINNDVGRATHHRIRP